MGKDETYVRSVWERVDFFLASKDFNQPQAVIWVGDDAHRFPDYAAAAEFTREHEEKVRLLRRDIRWVHRAASPEWEDIITEGDDVYNVKEEVRDACSQARVLSLLTSELTRLTTGMKDTFNG